MLVTLYCGLQLVLSKKIELVTLNIILSVGSPVLPFLVRFMTCRSEVGYLTNPTFSPLSYYTKHDI